LSEADIPILRCIAALLRSDCYTPVSQMYQIREKGNEIKPPKRQRLYDQGEGKSGWGFLLRSIRQISSTISGSCHRYVQKRVSISFENLVLSIIAHRPLGLTRDFDMALSTSSPGRGLHEILLQHSNGTPRSPLQELHFRFARLQNLQSSH
jgi:hypothetical protein